MTKGLKLEIETVPAKQLTLFPGNARKGNVKLIKESIEANGFYAPLVVQRSTSRILVGNHRFKAGLELGMRDFPVTYVDVTDTEARKLLLADNKTSDGAEYDAEALAVLIKSLDGDFIGSGFTGADLDKMLKELGEDTPDFEPENEGDDVRLDRKSVTDCPACGHTFTPETRSVIS